MADENSASIYAPNQRIVHKLVLTGGPCGGKTTGQTRLSSFFESIGWKVFRAPETATLLMSGGVKWTDLTPEQIELFQENLIRTMMQIEQTYFDLADLSNKNCIVICDRGVLDPSAYMSQVEWNKVLAKHDWKHMQLRDLRYNQVIHMVTAAKGAEEFYTTEDHSVRYEGPELARELDDKVALAWIGHPYYDVIDNSTDFEGKVVRMITSVCNRVGLDFSDRLSLDSRKRKFLIVSLPPNKNWPPYEEFDIIHDYLVTPHCKMQARIRKRGKDGIWTYTHTIRRPKIKGQRVELRKQLSGRTYQMLLAQRDDQRYTIYKKRRCFIWNNKCFQLDIYIEPCHPRCKGLLILESYTTVDGPFTIPDFLDSECEITDNPLYSMHNLSLKEYHPLEVKAGASCSSTNSNFNYRQVYANGATNGNDIAADASATSPV